MEDYLKSFEGLSARARNALCGHGYRNKQDVKDAIEQGEIRKTDLGTTVPNLGKKSLSEVFVWVGLSENFRELDKAQKIIDSEIKRSIKFLEQQGYEVTKK